MVQQDCATCVSGGFGGSFFKPRHGIVPCKSLHLYCIKAQITPMIKIMNKISNHTLQAEVLFSISIKSGNYIYTSEKLFPSKATSKPMQILWKTGSELILEQERGKKKKKKKEMEEDSVSGWGWLAGVCPCCGMKPLLWWRWPLYGLGQGPLLWWELSLLWRALQIVCQVHSAVVYLLCPLEGMIVARDVGHNGPLISLRGVDQVCKRGTWGVSARGEQTQVWGECWWGMTTTWLQWCT